MLLSQLVGAEQTLCLRTLCDYNGQRHDMDSSKKGQLRADAHCSAGVVNLQAWSRPLVSVAMLLVAALQIARARRRARRRREAPEGASAVNDLLAGG